MKNDFTGTGKDVPSLPEKREFSKGWLYIANLMQMSQAALQVTQPGLEGAVSVPVPCWICREKSLHPAQPHTLPCAAFLPESTRHTRSVTELWNELDKSLCDFSSSLSCIDRFDLQERMGCKTKFSVFLQLLCRLGDPKEIFLLYSADCCSP